MKAFVLLSLLVLAAFATSLAIGPSGLSFGELLGGLFGQGKESAVLIAQELRLPRALLGLMIGAALGLSGAALQGFLRNPLAEPGIFGVSSAASLGAVVVLYGGLAGGFALALPLGGLIGAAVAVALILALAGRDASTLGLVLAGIAVSSLAGALTALALNLAPSPFAVLEIVFWLLGSLADRSLDHVWLAGPFILVGMALLLSLGRTLEALTLGEDAARSLGFNLTRARLLLVIGTALAIGPATAVAGAIGFVGLVVPHLLRPLVGENPRQLLPLSALGGALLLLLSDVVTRAFPPITELKLGVVTALVGAPFFLWLVVRLRKGHA